VLDQLCRLIIVGRILEFLVALLELYDTLPQRPRHRGQSAAEQQQHNKQKYEQLPNTVACLGRFADKGEKVGLTASRSTARTPMFNSTTRALVVKRSKTGLEGRSILSVPFRNQAFETCKSAAELPRIQLPLAPG
jgi:hypothetical protein